MIQETIGIATGVGAAFCLSISYLFSRRYLHRNPDGVLSLLAYAHIMMGVASLVMLPLFWPGWSLITDRAVVRATVLASCLYLLGQAGLFYALRRVESSRVASFLGLKILILALLVTLWQGQSLGCMRWGAVLMSVAAAFLLNEAGGRIPVAGMAGLALAVSCYSLSDLNIKLLVTALAPAGATAPYLGVVISYLLCGAICLPLLFITGRGTGSMWLLAAPHAAAWFAAMFLLYASFGLIGVVFGNIVQSTRGLMAIGLSPLVVYWGWTHLEGQVHKRVFLKRTAGALLMLGAIVMYVI